eukprot:c13546_g1_i1 orf=1164-2390(-)
MERCQRAGNGASNPQLNLVDLDLLSPGHNDILSGGPHFVHKNGIIESQETMPDHTTSSSQQTCWAPGWNHLYNSCGIGETDYDSGRQGWQMSVLNPSCQRTDSLERAQGRDWGVWGIQLERVLADNGGLQKALVSNPLITTGSYMSSRHDVLGSSNGDNVQHYSLKQAEFCEVRGETIDTKGKTEKFAESLRSGNKDTRSEDLSPKAKQYLPVEQNATTCLGNTERDGKAAPNDQTIFTQDGLKECAGSRAAATADYSSMCLKLGKRTYFEAGGGSEMCREPSRSMPPAAVFAGSHTSKKQRILSLGVHLTRCQVEGCKADLNTAKDYHRRHKVCEMHSKAEKVIAHGSVQRFCQQCSKFHSLVEFDEAKRSCRRRLAGHNERRRKSSQETSAAVAASVREGLFHTLS